MLSQRRVNHLCWCQMNWTLHLWKGGSRFQILTLFVLDTLVGAMGWQEERLTMQKGNFKIISFDFFTAIVNKMVDRPIHMVPHISAYQSSHPLECHLLEFYTSQKRWLHIYMKVVKWNVSILLLGTGLTKASKACYLLPQGWLLWLLHCKEIGTEHTLNRIRQSGGASMLLEYRFIGGYSYSLARVW